MRQYAFLFFLLSGPVPAAAEAPLYLDAVRSEVDFSSVSSRSYYYMSAGLRTVMFVCDLKAGPSVHYFSPARYQSHMEFLNDVHLTGQRGGVFVDNNVQSPEPRFVMGFVTERPGRAYTAEFLPSDNDSQRRLLPAAYKAVSKSFFGPLKLLPLSERQRTWARQYRGMPFEDSPPPGRPAYQALSLGEAYGRVRVARDFMDQFRKGADEIVVLPEVPHSLLSVAGFVTAGLGGGLSHVTIMARTLKVPAAYIKGAPKVFAPLDGKYVRFSVLESTYAVSQCGEEEALAWLEARKKKAPPLVLQADLEYGGLDNLDSQSSADSVRFGAKSANLGQVLKFGLRGFSVPSGFTVPFRYYGEFVRDNGLAGLIDSLLVAEAAGATSEELSRRLAELRSAFQAGSLAPRLRKEIADRLPPGKGVFVRSSTNSEDLPGFSGAGLYTTVPNAEGAGQVAEAVKTVWGSLWNERAFDARRRFGIDHRSALPAVLIQETVKADSSGVMIAGAKGPGGRTAVEISAKQGLGMRVVEGGAAPERILYYPNDGTLEMVGFSEDRARAVPAEGGGVAQVPALEGEPALGKDMALRLARLGLAIQEKFGGIPQDIEWAVLHGEIYILQARPY